MEEQRQYKRFSTKLPVILQAITARKLKVFTLETKDISASGAFLLTKDTSYIQDDTRFIIDTFNPEKKRIGLKEFKQLGNCTCTLARSTSEGIAIHFDRPVNLFA